MASLSSCGGYYLTLYGASLSLNKGKELWNEELDLVRSTGLSQISLGKIAQIAGIALQMLGISLASFSLLKMGALVLVFGPQMGLLSTLEMGFEEELFSLILGLGSYLIGWASKSLCS